MCMHRSKSLISSLLSLLRSRLEQSKSIVTTKLAWVLVFVKCLQLWFLLSFIFSLFFPVSWNLFKTLCPILATSFISVSALYSLSFPSLVSLFYLWNIKKMWVTVYLRSTKEKFGSQCNSLVLLSVLACLLSLSSNSYLVDLTLHPAILKARTQITRETRKRHKIMKWNERQNINSIFYLNKLKF